ncbi:MAG: DUF2905 domain-containing protein [Acidobacteria bacterium]|nr:DUF2905 domain-containing protein [Acidobacteriota bacterium]
MGRLLVVVGLLLVAGGALLMAGVPLGRLPGDLVFRRGNTTLYLPLATCVLASIVLTLLLAFLRR